MKQRFLEPMLVLVLLLCFGAQASAQQEGFANGDHYTKAEVMIPMRDGVELYTQIYEPLDLPGPHPIMLFRTPYGVGSYGTDAIRNVLGPSALFAPSGYIFVYQDARGKFQSQGEFEVMKPVRSQLVGPDEVDECTDTYDTIEWLLESVPEHNGRVGQWGISYPGWETVMGMIDAHPALRASSPQASPSDMFIGDDFHHNGAFRLMYTFGWLAGNAASRTEQSTTGTGVAATASAPKGAFEFFLELGPLAEVGQRLFGGQVPTWDDYMRHGTYDGYWQERNALAHLDDITPAVLNVAGWFDAEDFYGPMSIYYEIEKNDPENESLLVVGPWQHGGWSSGRGDRLGDVRFGSRTSEKYRSEIEFPFFEWHLKDRGDERLPEAIVFETGSNEWRSHERWPPRAAARKNIYFLADGGLSFDPPKQRSGGEGAVDEFISDPDSPVPFSARVEMAQGHTWMVEDQRFAAGRPDVLVYRTEPLAEDVVIAGPILARLRVSTTGTDADWIVKLIDVFPDDLSKEPLYAESDMGGFQMLVAGEVFRSKFRNSFEKPEPLEPGVVTEIDFDLRDKYHCFQKGHSIMVQVQSTWFPVIDRNPQRFLDIYQAEADDYQKATHRVYRSPEAPSHLELSILPGG